jgi:hypothetical protein
MSMAAGRVFRRIEDRWVPVGGELPVWDHVPPRPNQPINVWVLPKGERYLARDVIVFGETGHRMLSLIPTDDADWTSVIDTALAIHSHEHVSEWVTQIELWLAITLADPWR